MQQNRGSSTKICSAAVPQNHTIEQVYI